MSTIHRSEIQSIVSTFDNHPMVQEDLESYVNAVYHFELEHKNEPIAYAKLVSFALYHHISAVTFANLIHQLVTSKRWKLMFVTPEGDTVEQEKLAEYLDRQFAQNGQAATNWLIKSRNSVLFIPLAS